MGKKIKNITAKALLPCDVLSCAPRKHILFDYIEFLTCWEDFGILGNNRQHFVQQTVDS